MQQIAFMTIVDNTPKYDPHHASGASFITFIKAKVCTRLWKEREKLVREFRELPCWHHEDEEQDEDNNDSNPLVTRLMEKACSVENMADEIIQKIEVEFLRKALPDFLEKLTDKEKSVIEMKFFKEYRGTQIAQLLDISEGRVTQLTQRALEKLGKAYIAALNTEQDNPYHKI